MGVPVTTLANTLMLDGVMRGRHSVDVGILILPILMETIAYLGDMAEVEYVMGTEIDETPQHNALVETAKQMATKRLMENRKNILTETDEEGIDVFEEEEEEQEIMSEPIRTGLMGRVE